MICRSAMHSTGCGAARQNRARVARGQPLWMLGKRFHNTLLTEFGEALNDAGAEVERAENRKM